MIKNINLQANSLTNLKQEQYIDSESFTIDSKDLKKLKINSWLQIEQEYLTAFYRENKKNIYKVKLYCSENYIFLKKKKKLDKKYSKSSKKDTFMLRFFIDKKIKTEIVSLCKNKTDAVMIQNRKVFAKVEVIFGVDGVFINIKEIL